jgi:hypothetical protein
MLGHLERGGERMEELTKWVESELGRYKAFWWIYLFFPLSLLLLFQFLMAPIERTGIYSPNILGYEALILFTYAFSFVSLIVFGRYPSETKIKNKLLEKAGKRPLTARRTNLFGLLFLGMMMQVDIPLFGFLLIFTSSGIPELEPFYPFGYFLFLLGVIAMISHRLRATRLVRNSLGDLGAKSR